MCGKSCARSCGGCCKKQEGKGLVLTEEEKDFLVEILNKKLFNIQGLVMAHQILEKIDKVFPIQGE